MEREKKKGLYVNAFIGKLFLGCCDDDDALWWQ
jgi:hypothetical protein